MGINDFFTNLCREKHIYMTDIYNGLETKDFDSFKEIVYKQLGLFELIDTAIYKRFKGFEFEDMIYNTIKDSGQSIERNRDLDFKGIDMLLYKDDTKIAIQCKNISFLYMDSVKIGEIVTDNMNKCLKIGIKEQIYFFHNDDGALTKIPYNGKELTYIPYKYIVKVSKQLKENDTNDKI